MKSLRIALLLTAAPVIIGTILCLVGLTMRMEDDAMAMVIQMLMVPILVGAFTGLLRLAERWYERTEPEQS